VQLRRLKEDPDDREKSFKAGPYTVTRNGSTFDVKGQVSTDFDIKLSIDHDTNASSISIGKDTTDLSTLEVESLISELSQIVKYGNMIDDDIYKIL
jgi:hypothetical protein